MAWGTGRQGWSEPLVDRSDVDGGLEADGEFVELDAAYLQRTLPDPFADQRQWGSAFWWRRRLAGGREGS